MCTQKTRFKLDMGPYIFADLVESDYIDDWTNLIQNLKQHVLSFENEPVIINIDWGNIIALIDELKTLKNSGQYIFSPTIKFVEKGFFYCVVNKEEKVATECIKRFFHLFYLCIILANPKHGNFFVGITVEDDRKRDSKQNYDFNISLEGDIFFYLNQLVEWPKLHTLPLMDVWNWLNKINLGDITYANSNIQKALFSLLYSVKANMAESQYEVELLYLCLGLEALYELPKLGIVNELRERIYLVLDSPEENRNGIKKAINNFYNLRSIFVHGELKLVNPIFSISSLTDSVTDDYEVYFWRANDFARAILVSTVQKMIINNWTKLNFSRIYRAR